MMEYVEFVLFVHYKQEVGTACQVQLVFSNFSVEKNRSVCETLWKVETVR